MTDASMISFPANGHEAGGYLATPDGGAGPGLLVVQEWWGLDPAIKASCDRFAGEGFVALAPDLYHGDIAEHTEMDKAGELMNSLPPDRAAADMGGAIDHLLALDAVTGERVGVVGFCMGGLLSLVISAFQGDRVAVTVPFYGAPLGEAEPDWSGLTAKVEGHFAEQDDFFPPDAVKDLETRLRAMGKDVTFHVHPGTGHAFASGHDALGTQDDEASATAWTAALAFLKANLSGT
jgi:carboxymethylenebutenolidase